MISGEIKRYRVMPRGARGLGAGKASQGEVRRVAELAERLTTYSKDAALPGAELYLILENHAVQHSLPVMDKVLHYIAEKLG
ncbi:hypothetical protein [Infirmifilum sp. SLHALR2]|nr:MAG: hypothetical protein B7L53_08335 [Thermofilum sp. NZ13]